MQNKQYSFKINIRRDDIPSLSEVKTYRSNEKTGTDLTSRTNLQKQFTKLNTRTSSIALSTSRKTSMTLFTNRSERNNDQNTFKKQQSLKNNSTQKNCKAIDLRSPVNRHKSSISYASYQSTNYKTLNTQQSVDNNTFSNTPQTNKGVKQLQNFTKQQQLAQKQASPPINLQDENLIQQRENILDQLNIGKSESKDVQDLEVKQHTENEIQFEFDIEDIEQPNINELRKRLDSQFGYSRDQYCAVSPIAARETPLKNVFNFVQEQDIDMILGDVFQNQNYSFECDNKNIGIEFKNFEPNIGDKIKQSQFNILPQMAKEINVYSALEYQLQQKNLEKSTIDKKLEKQFQQNQCQKKIQGSFGSTLLIEYTSRLEKTRSSSSTQKTISIIVLDEINEDEQIIEDIPKVIQKEQTTNQQKPKRCSIFLAKNTLNFGQLVENQGQQKMNNEDQKIDKIQLNKKNKKKEIQNESKQIHLQSQLLKKTTTEKLKTEGDQSEISFNDIPQAKSQREIGCNDQCSIF